MWQHHNKDHYCHILPHFHSHSLLQDRQLHFRRAQTQQSEKWYKILTSGWKVWQMLKYLIRFIEQTQCMSITHQLVELLMATSAKLIGLDSFFTNHWWSHDATMPVWTKAITSWPWTKKYWKEFFFVAFVGINQIYNANLCIVLIGFIFSLGSFRICILSVIPPSCSEWMAFCRPFLCTYTFENYHTVSYER